MDLTDKLESPQKLKLKLQTSLRATQNVALNRQIIGNILDRTDPRMLIIVGPCSFHDPEACLEYAERLKTLADEVVDKFFLVMRVYPEKPRTSVGWKGYISDPFLDNTNCIQEGISNTRKFMMDLCEMNLPIATEILSPTAYLYYEDLLSWASIGARTSESQTHREIAASLPFPIGFKNNTAGDIAAAVNGILFANRKQSFIGVNPDGNVCIINASGNPYAHLILRGGKDGPNYSKQHVDKAQSALACLNVSENIIVDCSHDNSSKNYLNQERVFHEVLSQKINGNQAIIGTMIESFLLAENQPIPTNTSRLKYGCSITDSCLSWEATGALIRNAYLATDEISLSESELILN